jgi:heme exporter protein D
MTLQEFFHMGGYAFYVWTSYGIAFLVLAYNLISPAWQRRKLLRRIHQRGQRVRNRQ